MKDGCQTYADMLLESFKKADLMLVSSFLFHFTAFSILWRTIEPFLATGSLESRPAEVWWKLARLVGVLGGTH